jgi:UDP-N-acetylmuramoylalanine--D-glutamate ligase
MRDMLELEKKNVAVIGLGGRGRAACKLLAARGARVTGLDIADTADLREGALSLRSLDVEVKLGATAAPRRDFDLAVLCPAVPRGADLVQYFLRRQVRLIGELELGFQLASCLSIAITGTNGKGTVAEMVGRMLASNGRKAVICGHRAQPVCSVVEESKDLDFLILQVNCFQLEAIEFFRPAVAVLTNLAPDHQDRYARHEDYALASASIFRNQQVFDWAVIQSAALARLKQLGQPIAAKTVTFGAADPEADLHSDRSLLISRLANWAGPLLNLEQCQIRGPHNAENLLAALAVGHALRLPLERMTEPLQTYPGGAHRCQLVADLRGVQFVNDSKARTVDALEKALLTVRPGAAGEPNVWLIAGGRSQGGDYHDVGPLLSKRVKGAFLVGEAAESLRAAWSLFTPCATAGSLLEAVSGAAKNAAPGDVVLLSPACSSFDQFRDYQHRGEVFCEAVRSLDWGGGT